MPVSTSYTQLTSDIQKYVDDDVAEFVSELPGIINKAMVRCQRELEFSFWREKADTSLDAKSATWARSSDMLKIYGIVYTNSLSPIVRRSEDFVFMYSNKSGPPRFYAEDEEGTIMLGPVPDNNYAVRVSYLKRLAALSGSNETNWITDNAGDLLLYAALVGSEVYLVGQDRKGEFEVEYQKALAAIRAEMRGLHDNDYAPLRTSAITTGLS